MDLMQNYNILFLVIIVVSIFMKILHDVFRYKRDKAWENLTTEKMQIYGKLYHIFGFLALVVPFTVLLVGRLSSYQFILFGVAFFAIYSFMMSFGFNVLAGKNWFYVGQTENTDIWIRRTLGLKYNGEKGYDELSAKQKQGINFRAALVYFVRLVLAIGGYVLLEYL